MNNPPHKQFIIASIAGDGRPFSGLNSFEASHLLSSEIENRIRIKGNFEKLETMAA